MSVPVVVGMDFKRVPLDVLERFSIDTNDLPDALRACGEPAVILSTCNRTEIYGSSPAVRASFGASPLPAGVFELHGEDAVRHLFSVAAGIESMVIGEPQIRSQVGRALRAAKDARTAGPELSALFVRALLVGKRARSETRIEETATTLSRVAMDALRAELGSLIGRRALVVGAGRMSELVCTSLLAEGAHIVVVNRTPAKARSLAAKFGGDAIDLGLLAPTIADADIVVSATGSHVPMIDARAIGERARRLVVIDLAVPRDVDEAAGRIDGVTLYNMEHFRRALTPSGEQLLEIERVRAIVEDEVNDLMRTQLKRGA